MEHQRFRLCDDNVCLLLLQFPDISIPQIGIESVKIKTHENFLYQFHCCLDQQIQQEVLRHIQHDNLREHCDDLRNRRNVRLDIIALLRIGQTIFISHEISTHRVKKEDQIIDRQFPA